MSRYRVWAVWAVAAWATACGSSFDLIVSDAVLIDGSGDARRRGDVAVRDGRIVRIGDAIRGRAEQRIDAAGRVLAPGFIDLHSHADLIVQAPLEEQRRLLGARLRQGVTTIVLGNCGLGVAPTSPQAAAMLAPINGWMTPAGIRSPAASVGGFLDRLEANGVALNVATLAPHGPVRISAMGLTPGAPDDETLAAMEEAVGRALDEGAFGLSTGLIYPPGMFSETEELVSLARVVASRDGLYTSHVRGSSETLLDATRELIEIARRSGARVHHSHMEAVGEEHWSSIEAMLALEDAARDEGLAVSHDVFLYTRAATMMSAIFPPWSLQGGLPSLLDRLRDPASRERIAVDMTTGLSGWHNLVGAVGWDGILVASHGGETASPWIGRSVAEIAAELDRDPFDWVVELMLDADGEVGQQVAEISGAPGRLDGLLAIYRHPAAAVISDAEDYGHGVPHPAHAGAFARALRMAPAAGLTLEQAVHKMTGYPAALLGLDDRGLLREGAVADLVLFAPQRVADRADWNDPRRPAEGIDAVWIAGRRADAGEAVGEVLRAGSD